MTPSDEIIQRLEDRLLILENLLSAHPLRDTTTASYFLHPFWVYSSIYNQQAILYGSGHAKTAENQ